MRLNINSSIITLAVVSALAHGFHVAGRPTATRTSTSLAARRSMLPVLRRSDLFFPDVDRMFDEMDEMMESPSVTIFPRPSLSLLGRDIPKELNLPRPI